jgi:hypothetical protein
MQPGSTNLRFRIRLNVLFTALGGYIREAGRGSFTYFTC